ncbi:MAG: cytochrome c biogenesis protein CcsA [Verrucomicrobiales bacterium]|nr:cytochrome c biogenesis protein CcsA [Verrucomicrobiales bacterium]
MSTKRQIREKEEAEMARTRAGQRFSAMKIAYLVVSLLLVGGVFLSLRSAAFLSKNMRSSKNMLTNLESYTPWPDEVRGEFQKMLVQNGGRVKPANTFARFTLLQINNGTHVRFETKDGEKHDIRADEWLLDSLFRGDIAKELPIFNVDDTDVIAELGVKPKIGDEVHRKRDRYSYNQLLVARPKIAEEGSRVTKKKQEFSESNDDPELAPRREEEQVLRLSRNMSLFEYMLGQFGAVRKGENMVNDQILPANLAEIAKRLDMSEFLDLMPEMTPQQLFGVLSQPAPTEEGKLFQSPFQLFFFFANSGRNLVIFPPQDRLNGEWISLGDVMFEAMQDKSKRAWAKEQLAGVSKLYTAQKEMFGALNALGDSSDKSAKAAVIKPMADAMKSFVDNQKAETVARYEAHLREIDEKIAAADESLEKERLNDKRELLKQEGKQTDREVTLYNSGYFQSSLAWFIVAFLMLAISWLVPGSRFSKIFVYIAVGLTALALFYDVIGIIQRCVVRARPPITNLYDTIIFITAVAVFLALALEYFTRRGVGLIVAVLAGMGGMFLSLRYEVKEATDTMDPLQAVLDTNFWLATHVTTINIGYAAGLLAMLLGLYYLLHRFLRPFFKVMKSVAGKEVLDDRQIFEEDKDTRGLFRSISKMIYGVVCFCLIFAIIGTILGGVWANYSWGRFWGWDPKENGALMICLWSLVILHARMGGFIKDIGIAMNAVFLGMIVTFSWWGVNNLGIGLHSYGFTQGVWDALYISWTVCGFVMACGIPLWLHERNKKGGKKSKSPKREAEPVSGDLADGGAPAV